MWEQLSNSGEFLKLLIPSYNISGWISSCVVTMQKIFNNRMENHGSKSDLKSVNEQRVYGNWHKNNYVFKIYSNGIRKKLSNQNPLLNKYIENNLYKGDRLLSGLKILKLSNFSTVSQTNLSGEWIAGFVDAEGCFRIAIIKNKNYKGDPWSSSLYNEKNLNNTMPLSIRLYFQIGLHLRDENILKLIQSKLGVGKIYKSRLDSVELQVSSFKDMSTIIDFFDKYPLITQKWGDYLLFKKAYELILNKEHLTIEGLKKLVATKALINRGLPDQLKQAFPNLESFDIERCEVNKEITDPNWISGFASGEGSFMVRVFNSTSHAIGYQAQLRFQITQQFRDKKLMEKIVDYLDCGYISERGDIVDFQVTKIKDITDKIIPFFKKHPIVGVKLDNFNYFCEAANLINNKEHLTLEGLEKIKLIKSKMNTLKDIN